MTLRNTLLVALITTFSMICHADTSNTDPLCDGPYYSSSAIDHDHLQNILTETIRLHFPDLVGQDIELRPKLNDPQYFFSTMISVQTLFDSEHTYLIDYNPDLLAHPPTDQALQAILTHELYHVVDIKGRSPFENIGFGIEYGLKIDLDTYEHFTDLRAIHSGEPDGLIAYRCWIYSRLSGQALEDKKEIYMTPQEIKEAEIKPATL